MNIVSIDKNLNTLDKALRATRIRVQESKMQGCLPSDLESWPPRDWPRKET